MAMVAKMQCGVYKYNGIEWIWIGKKATLVVYERYYKGSTGTRKRNVELLFHALEPCRYKFCLKGDYLHFIARKYLNRSTYKTAGIELFEEQTKK